MVAAVSRKKSFSRKRQHLFHWLHISLTSPGSRFCGGAMYGPQLGSDRHFKGRQWPVALRSSSWC